MPRQMSLKVSGSSRESGRMTDLSGYEWRKSSYCNYNSCVEVAFVDGQVAVRDAKDRSGPVLRFTTAEWRTFLAKTRRGGFDWVEPTA
jgi:Domain of unknown function (DUF397)